jgi:hypothetical protein
MVTGRRSKLGIFPHPKMFGKREGNMPKDLECSL